MVKFDPAKVEFDLEAVELLGLTAAILIVSPADNCTTLF
jgi:hypothetical protein